jgi:general secretion pathway protein N
MIKAVLAAVAIALGGLVYLQWSDWPPPAQRVPVSLGEAQPQTAPDPIAGLSPLEDREEYAAIKERPLFRPDRRPREDEPDAAVEPPPDEPADLAGVDLTGVLISPGVTTAWVKDPAQPAPLRVRLGETLAGWTVKDIKPDRLVLERQGKTDTLLLRAFNAPGASPPPAPPPATPRRPGAPGRPAPPAAKPPTAMSPPRVPSGAPPAPGAAPQTQVKGPGARLRPPAGNQDARPNVRRPTPQSPE